LLKKSVKQDIQRCSWVNADPLYLDYHDHEWGVPVYDDRLLFEFLCLEGAQAGLSWLTILKKRAHYQTVFDHFKPEKIALYNQRKINSLLNDAGIVRNSSKVNAFIQNAKAYLQLKEQGISLSSFLWNFVDGKPIRNYWETHKEIPATTDISNAMAKALKKNGFKFVGPTICYAFMQAVGMVNDHTVDCFRFVES